MLGRSLKMAFWVTYDHLFKLILANIVWALAVMPFLLVAVTSLLSGHRDVFLFLGAPAGFVGMGVVLPVMTAGLAHMVKELIDTRDGSVRDMFVGIRLYWRRAVGIGLIYATAMVCLATSAGFYAVKLRESVPWVGYGLSALALWALTYMVLTSLLVIPALVQKKAGVGATIKLAVLLVMAHPLFSAGLAVQVLAVTAISVMLSPALFFLYGALVVVLVSSGYEMLARRYAALERRQAAPEQAGRPSAARDAALEDEQDDYLNRGFRDFLFPWKG